MGDNKNIKQQQRYKELEYDKSGQSPNIIPDYMSKTQIDPK